MASSTMNLKLLVDKKRQRVLFAEVNKDFVDFLFHIFTLPLGTLVEFLGSKQMVGCLGKLKESIESLNETYLQSDIEKDEIFNPKSASNENIFMLSYDVPDDKSDAPKTLYRCPDIYGDCPKYVTEYLNAKCPSCNNYPMNNKVTIFVPEKEAVAAKERKKSTGGYVKEVVTYMVMDDLAVKPMSTISSITFINTFGVNDLSQLEEKMVSFGKDKVMKLLKESLETDKVLTTVFLNKKP